MELASVRVNAVSPGVVRTNLWQDMPTEDREKMNATIGGALPVGRVSEAVLLHPPWARFGTVKR
jgi:NAD(P)-dependent dehydrogenase (short-subunit alcohol dehydrogenase family)